jgi:hypothetical protein
VEKFIFLSAYDKRKFPNGDERKPEVFTQAFFKLYENNCDLSFFLIGYDSEEKGATKAD